MMNALHKPGALMLARRGFLIMSDTVYFWFKEWYLNNEEEGRAGDG